MCEKIKLSLINGHVMTFNPNDYMKLRTEHRIVGNLIGVTVPYPRNVNLSALPAHFSDCETRLMLEQNIADLEERISLNEVPTEEMKEAYESHQKKVVTELEKPYIDSKLETVVKNMDHIVKGKRKKLLKSGVPEDEINITPEDIISEETLKIQQTIAGKVTLTQIPTEHPFRLETRLISDFPVADEHKFRIFRDLWLSGLYITNGDTFGCDFLTYVGDPMLFHASQMVHVIKIDDEFDQTFITSCARMSVSVRKKCVFAYISEEGDEIIYQTLEWDNPKLREMYSAENRKNVEEEDETEDLV